MTHPDSTPASLPATPRPKPVNRESPFRIDELFFSTTDPAGVITFGNDVFIRVSGYPAGDLVGRPHNIIRHPDMPRCVFALLWETVQAGKSIAAYVKNLARDGSYYWVLAFVVPIDGGYLSIRLKPTSPLFDQVRGLYQQLKEIEQAVEETGEGRKAAIDASTPKMLEAVSQLGFADYGQLMAKILLDELAARDKAMTTATAKAAASASTSSHSSLIAHHSSSPSSDLHQACNNLTAAVEGFFSQLHSFGDLGGALLEQIGFVRGLGRELQMLALNAQLASASLGNDGITLRVVSQQMSDSATHIATAAKNLAASMDQAVAGLRAASFGIGASRLSMEMMSTFLGELQPDSSPANQSRRRVASLAEVVSNNLADATTRAGQAAEQIRQLHANLDGFMKQIRTLEVLHVSGKVEAVRCATGDGVRTVFGQLQSKTRQTRDKLNALTDLTSSAQVNLPDQHTLTASLQALAA